MKIAATSNFDLETFNEYFVAHDVNVHFANKAINAIGKSEGEFNSDVYYRVVDDNYKLQIWEP